MRLASEESSWYMLASAGFFGVCPIFFVEMFRLFQQRRADRVQTGIRFYRCPAMWLFIILVLVISLTPMGSGVIRDANHTRRDTEFQVWESFTLCIALCVLGGGLVLGPFASVYYLERWRRYVFPKPSRRPSLRLSEVVPWLYTNRLTLLVLSAGFVVLSLVIYALGSWFASSDEPPAAMVRTIQAVPVGASPMNPPAPGESPAYQQKPSGTLAPAGPGLDSRQTDPGASDRFNLPAPAKAAEATKRAPADDPLKAVADAMDRAVEAAKEGAYEAPIRREGGRIDWPTRPVPTRGGSTTPKRPAPTTGNPRRPSRAR